MGSSDAFKERRRLVESLVSRYPVLDIGFNGHKWEKLEVKTLDLNMRLKPDYLFDLEEGLPERFRGEFGTIIAGDVLEHIKNYEKLVRACKMALKEKGELIIPVPNICSLRSRILMLFGRLPAYSAWDYRDCRHVNDFSLYRLEKLLLENGFRIGEAYPFGMLFGGHYIGIRTRTLGDSLILKAVKA
jgi:hypothetical protein